MFVRRRPLLRAGMLAGTAYAAHRAGERSVQRQYAEADQDQRLNRLESQPYAAPPAPPAGGDTGEVDLSHLDEADASELWDAADAIPPGTTAAVALIEHQWATPLRDAIQRAGGMPIADAWLAPEDVASIGLSAS
jgi:hypothetical protein